MMKKLIKEQNIFFIFDDLTQKRKKNKNKNKKEKEIKYLEEARKFGPDGDEELEEDCSVPQIFNPRAGPPFEIRHAARPFKKLTFPNKRPRGEQGRIAHGRGLWRHN